jgi:hypothetical protein
MAVVTLPYDPVWRALEWAKVHCPSYITNDAKPANPNESDRHYYSDRLLPDINYYFSDERDAVLFALTWR